MPRRFVKTYQTNLTNLYINLFSSQISTGTGIAGFLPIAFVAGFGLLLLIPLLLLFFTTGFGPGFGYAGYASRKRSIDDFFEPMFSNLHPMVMNLAKNPALADLWKKADKEGLLSNLQPVIMDIVNGKAMKSEQFKANVHNFINPIIKDVLPSEWRRAAVHLASKFMKTMSDSNLNKNEYLHKNKLDSKTNIKIVSAADKDAGDGSGPSKKQ